MPDDQKNDKKETIIAIIGLILCFACIPALVLLLTLGGPWLHHIIAGLTGGGNQPGGNSNYGVGNCATTQTLDGVTLPKAKGPLSSEQHLATTAENFSDGWPTSTHDQDERHYQVTNFSVNCAGCPKQGFTPSEGGGNIGGGTGSKPSPNIEPWLVNVLKDLPKNSKVLIHSVKTNKTVVTIGGYEKGPGDPSFAGGARDEVLHALGIEHKGEVEIGFAQDQSLMYGPVTCVDPNALAATGPCSQKIVSIAAHEADIGYRGTKCSGQNKNDIQKYCSGCTAWCSCFVTWVYKQAGYLNNTVPGPMDLKDNYQSRLTVISPNGNPAQIHPGDIFWIHSSQASSGWHVGIVERVAGNKIYTIEGNITGDVVARRIKNASSIVYVARPKNCI